MERGANVHAATSMAYGRTPLQGAAENGRLDMISVIWNATGSSKFSEEDGRHASELAKQNGHIACHDLIQELYSTDQELATSEANDNSLSV